MAGCAGRSTAASRSPGTSRSCSSWRAWRGGCRLKKVRMPTRVDRSWEQGTLLMPALTTTAVLGLLRGGRLLRPRELHELDGIAAHYQTPSALIRAVLKRGWLTAYQAQELLAGRGRELLIGE